MTEGGAAKVPEKMVEFLNLIDQNFMEYLQSKLENAKTDAEVLVVCGGVPCVTRM
jgi:hypothetical protein